MCEIGLPGDWHSRFYADVAVWIYALSYVKINSSVSFILYPEQVNQLHRYFPLLQALYSFVVAYFAALDDWEA